MFVGGGYAVYLLPYKGHYIRCHQHITTIITSLDESCHTPNTHTCTHKIPHPQYHFLALSLFTYTM